MSLRRWKTKFQKAKKSVTEGVSGVVDTVTEKASGMLATDLTFELAQEELANDLEKGLRIFDEIGLPQEKGDELQEEIAEYAMLLLKENFPKKD